MKKSRTMPPGTSIVSLMAGFSSVDWSAFLSPHLMMARKRCDCCSQFRTGRALRYVTLHGTSSASMVKDFGVVAYPTSEYTVELPSGKAINKVALCDLLRISSRTRASRLAPAPPPGRNDCVIVIGVYTTVYCADPPGGMEIFASPEKTSLSNIGCRYHHSLEVFVTLIDFVSRVRTGVVNVSTSFSTCDATAPSAVTSSRRGSAKPSTLHSIPSNRTSPSAATLGWKVTTVTISAPGAT
mmetsp:Transcript_11727/g.30117  ORF Transcript_11727/g.30117 Transcript_11727/m.30117 type:complete len:240 (+) Transcript_11727:2524-3243(+)